MLPTHRLQMPNGKVGYHGDDKYDKLKRQKACFSLWRRTFFFFSAILIWSIYTYLTPHSPLISDEVPSPEVVSDNSVVDNYVSPPGVPDQPQPQPQHDKTIQWSPPPVVQDEENMFGQNLPPASSLYPADPDIAEKQARIVEAFKHAWKGYATDAFGKDEYQPLTHRGKDWAPGGIGLMIVDSLDTMLLMNLTDEYAQAREWVATSLDFNKKQDVNVFETTIRVLGGLLSAYHLSGNDSIYLEKATDLGQRLIGAFHTPSGIPYASVVLSSGLPYTAHVPSSTAEATTVQLEFKYLSHLTGDPQYWQAAERVMQRMKELTEEGHTVDGLVPILIHPTTGYFATKEIRLGSRGDSYYEYLIKQYLQTKKTEPLYMDMYHQTVEGIRKHLVGHTSPNKFMFIGEINTQAVDRLSPKMDHLVCFIGGMFALGATQGMRLEDDPLMSHTDQLDMDMAREITRTCYEMYNTTATGLASEIVYFNTDLSSQKDITIKPADRHSLLRPETLESLFIMYRITGDPVYREWGWRIFEALEEHARLPDRGYAALKDVTRVPPPQDDRMDTFFLAETLKYLYLLFSPNDLIPLDKYVLNTEAHPLPIFAPK